MTLGELIHQLQELKNQMDSGEDIPVVVAHTDQDSPYADDLAGWAAPVRVTPDVLFNLESDHGYYAVIHVRLYPVPE